MGCCSMDALWGEMKKHELSAHEVTRSIADSCQMQRYISCCASNFTFYFEKLCLAWR